MVSGTQSIRLLAATSIACSALITGSVSGQSTQPYTEVVDGMLITEGDIIVGYASDAEFTKRGFARSSLSKRWPNGLVYYQYDPGLSDIAVGKTEEAIKHWNDNSSIRMVKRIPDTGQPGANNYIVFTLSSRCSSFVGMLGGAQAVNTHKNCGVSTMIHEIGHAIGLHHEQNRSDRDEHVIINWANIGSDHLSNFNKKDSGTVDIGKYDYLSRMHYGEYTFSSNGQKTIQAIDPAYNGRLGQRDGLSEGDLHTINSLYGTDLGLTTDALIAGDTTEVTFSVANLGSKGAHGLELTFSANVGQPIPFTGDETGECVHISDVYRCGLDLIETGTVKSIRLSIPGQWTEVGLMPVINSNTFDIDLRNNTVSQEAIDAEIAAAEAAAAGSDTSVTETNSGENSEAATSSSGISSSETSNTETSGTETSPVGPSGAVPSVGVTLNGESDNASSSTNAAGVPVGGGVHYWTLLALFASLLYRGSRVGSGSAHVSRQCLRRHV